MWWERAWVQAGEIVSLKTQIQEARRLDEVMCSKLKERNLQCKRLEDKVDSAKRELDEKSKFCKQLEIEITFMNDSEEKSSSSKASIKDNQAVAKRPL